MAEIDGNVSEMRRILLFLYQLFQMFHLSHLSRLSRMQQVCSFSRAVALFFLFLRSPGDSPEVHQRSFAALRMTKSQAVIPSLLSGPGSTDGEILRYAQDDRPDASQARSREVFSPNVCFLRNPLDKYSVVGYILSNRFRKLSTPM